MLRTNVVSAKAARPSGPGSAIGVGTNDTSCAATGAVGSARSSRVKRGALAAEASISLSLDPKVVVRSRVPVRDAREAVHKLDSLADVRVVT